MFCNCGFLLTMFGDFGCRCCGVQTKGVFNVFFEWFCVVSIGNICCVCRCLICALGESVPLGRRFV